MNTLTIELPKETAEKLDLLKQAYEKRKQVLLSLRALCSNTYLKRIYPGDNSF